MIEFIHTTGGGAMMDKCAELRFDENYVRVCDFKRYDPSAYHDVDFNLAVCSDGFGGVAPCECCSGDLVRAADELAEMYDFAREEVLLQDRLYRSCVKFELQRTGRVSVSGKIYGEHCDQSLEFVFEADQTVLKSFVAQLRALLN